MLRKIKNKSGLLVMLLSMLALNAGFIPNAFAVGYLSKASVILTNDEAAAAGSVIVEFTTSSTNTGSSLTLQFNGYTGTTNGFVAATQPVSNSYNGSTCMSITGASAYLPGAPAATGTPASGLITFSGLTAMVASTSYCAVLSSATAVTTPSAAGASTATITAGSDTADPVSLYTIANDTVTVNASVPPSFTFGLVGNSDNLNGLSTGSVTGTTGVTASVSTNSKSGWYLFGSDANSGLHSTTQNYTIASGNTVGSIPAGTNTTLTSNHEGYVSAVTTAGIVQGTGAGTTTPTAAFASTATGMGAGLSTSEEEMASSTGTASGASVPVKEFAAIGATTPAALDYTDTITLVAAGSF